METKSIRRSLVLLMILLLAVESSGCPCFGDEDTNDIAGDCRSALKCLKVHESECAEGHHYLAKKLLEITKCEVIKVCAMEIGLPIIFQLMEDKIQNDQIEEHLRSGINEKYPCMVDQEEMNNMCTNEASAKRCFRKVFKKYECVAAVLSECKVKGLKDIA